MLIDLYRRGEQKPFTTFEGDVLGTPADVVLLQGKAYRFHGSTSSKTAKGWTPSWTYIEADTLDLTMNTQFREIPT